MKIYKIECLINVKIYICQTRRPLEERISEHKRADSLIGRAIRHYGLDNFKIEVLAEFNDSDELNEMEKFWIAKLNCKSPKCYNLTDGGLGTSGYIRKPLSETSRLNMSAASAKRSILCVEENLEFESITAAAKWYKRNIKSITRACKTGGTSAGYHWKYLSESPVSEETLMKIKSVHCKNPVICIETDIKFESIAAEAAWCGGRTENISRACRGIKLTAYGFHWKYADKEVEPVEHKGRKTRAVYCIEAKILYESIKYAAKINNCDSTIIIRACQNINRTAAGYHWCYYKDLETIKVDNLSAPKEKKSVRCVETNKIFPSIRCAAKWCGVNHSQIVRVCKGEQKTAAGFHWEII